MEDISFKIRIRNKKESAEIQRILFKLGYYWGRNERYIQHTDKVGLFFEIEDLPTYKNITYTTNLDYFKKHRCKEVTFERLKSKEFLGYLIKLMILKELAK